MMDNLKTEFGKSFENTNDEEVWRLNKEQPKQLNEFEEVVRLVKEILQPGSVFPTKQKKNSMDYSMLWRTCSVKRRLHGKAQE